MPDSELDLVVEQEGDVTIIVIRSPRVVADMSDAFEERVVQTVEELENPKVLIDFEAVEFISSAMLGKLIKLNGRVGTDQGGQLRLSSLDAKIAVRVAGSVEAHQELFSVAGDTEDFPAADPV